MGYIEWAYFRHVIAPLPCQFHNECDSMWRMIRYCRQCFHYLTLARSLEKPDQQKSFIKCPSLAYSHGDCYSASYGSRRFENPYVLTGRPIGDAVGGTARDHTKRRERREGKGVREHNERGERAHCFWSTPLFPSSVASPRSIRCVDSLWFFACFSLFELVFLFRNLMSRFDLALLCCANISKRRGSGCVWFTVVHSVVHHYCSLI